MHTRILFAEHARTHITLTCILSSRGAYPAQIACLEVGPCIFEIDAMVAEDGGRNILAQ